MASESVGVRLVANDDEREEHRDPSGNVTEPSASLPVESLDGHANPKPKPKRRKPINRRRIITAEDYERERKRKAEVQLMHLRDELEDSGRFDHS